MVSIVQEPARSAAYAARLRFTPRAPVPTVLRVDSETSVEADFGRRLGRLLRELRLATMKDNGQRLTQEDVAEAIGKASDTIGRWEKGSHMPSAFDVARLAALYHVPSGKRAIFLDPPEWTNPIADLLEAEWEQEGRREVQRERRERPNGASPDDPSERPSGGSAHGQPHGR